jgi:flagellar biosynthesis GTPase FlhF
MKNEYYKLFALGILVIGIFTACEPTPENRSVTKKPTLGAEAKQIEAIILRGESVSQAHLIGLSAEELRILRNAVFARHGRQYQKDGLGAYFYTCNWYQPNPAFSLDQLTNIDKQNVQTILQSEEIAKLNDSKLNANSSNSNSILTDYSGAEQYQYQQPQDLLKQQEEARKREQMRQQQEFEEHHREEEQQYYQQQQQESQRRYEEQQRQQQEQWRRQQEMQRQQEYQRQQQLQQQQWQQQQRRY